MAKRDPERTARNKKDEEISARLKALLPRVLELTGFRSEQSLHGTYGGKQAEYIDIKNAVIHTPEQFLCLWQRGYMDRLRRDEARLSTLDESHAYKNFLKIQNHPEVQEYVDLFLKRTFLRNYAALAKKRPPDDEAFIWMGHNNASYGLFVTPRFRENNWENDGSEIRHFSKRYWTIGHVLSTGFVIPFRNARVPFSDVGAYLNFFEYTMVRASGSPHEAAIAKRYSNFVRNAKVPEDVPLLIPEFRYGGISSTHVHRLDFCIIEPLTMDKIGFELSPWSTHGKLTGTNSMTQKAINMAAQENFEREMKKHKDYFHRHGIFSLIYTDSDLQNPDSVFETIERFLVPKTSETQLQLSVESEFLAFGK